MKIRNIDFFSDACAQSSRARATSFRLAWKLAVESRAPKGLRADLRMLMRGNARDAVDYVRRNLAHHATLRRAA